MRPNLSVIRGLAVIVWIHVASAGMAQTAPTATDLRPPAGPDDTESTVDDVPWQMTISAQIQAFRDRDAAAAFSYAGAGFQTAFADADTFFQAIVSSGYAPIMQSRSHSFGSFQLSTESGVLQEVRFVGGDQELYTAIYQLVEEPQGWRVQAVQLLRQPGIAV